ncbi:uncharacterized protein LY89DRAFT_743744 [Mollisia scopiformis]|uniref:Uncharacterized protein n=1 Tax=Mollisia scopiformis TaxID=149040 RepID=A0A132B2I6_MOLSC|nr:uncharacterized protein LY89DRAFT_743744 [Mollisia scopiformis]KUJ06602.1 hypothetical protein LY89DRAFT_743744 [Mollisia scopiformis]
MIAHGVATTLSNDDPAIEGQNDARLSYDYFEAVQAFDNVGFAGLGRRAQNSARYSNFLDQDDNE